MATRHRPLDLRIVLSRDGASRLRHAAAKSKRGRPLATSPMSSSCDLRLATCDLRPALNRQLLRDQLPVVVGVAPRQLRCLLASEVQLDLVVLREADATV